MKDSAVKLLSANSVQLDPMSCGSMIGYIITVNAGALSGGISLTDCSRMINWCFGEYDGGVKKVDAAIKILSEFRNHYAKAEAALSEKKK